MTGTGRNRKLTKALAVPAYIWVRHLGRSGYALAKALGVTPRSLYAASSRTEGYDAIKSKDIERLCK